MTREDVRQRLLVEAEGADQYEAIALRNAARWVAEGYDLLRIRDSLHTSAGQGDTCKQAFYIVNQAVWEGLR